MRKKDQWFDRNLARIVKTVFKTEPIVFYKSKSIQCGLGLKVFIIFFK